MSNVAVYCAGTLGEVSQVVDSVTVYTATCSQSWSTYTPPTGEIDATELGGWFVAVFTLTLIFYFTVALPGGKFLRVVQQSLRNLL